METHANLSVHVQHSMASVIQEERHPMVSVLYAEVIRIMVNIVISLAIVMRFLSIVIME